MSVEERIARIEERLDAVAEDTSETAGMLREVLHGASGQPGVLVRVDRLEQWKAGASKVIWTLVTCVLGLGASLASWWVKE